MTSPYLAGINIEGVLQIVGNEVGKVSSYNEKIGFGLNKILHSFLEISFCKHCKGIRLVNVSYVDAHNEVFVVTDSANIDCILVLISRN